MASGLFSCFIHSYTTERTGLKICWSLAIVFVREMGRDKKKFLLFLKEWKIKFWKCVFVRDGAFQKSWFICSKGYS